MRILGIWICCTEKILLCVLYSFMYSVAVILVYNFGKSEELNAVEGEGMYNPKSEWMITDSRRTDMPDIEGNFDVA